MIEIKPILEKLIRLITIIATIIGLIAIILLLRLHLYYYPIIIKFNPQEILLFLYMIVLFIQSIRFEMKYLKWITIIGIILAGINLIGFDIFINIV